MNVADPLPARWQEDFHEVASGSWNGGKPDDEGDASWAQQQGNQIVEVANGGEVAKN